MPGRSLKASSARPSQTPLEGRADDASCLTSNTVAHQSVTRHSMPTGIGVRGTLCVGQLLSQKEREKRPAKRRKGSAWRSTTGGRGRPPALTNMAT